MFTPARRIAATAAMLLGAMLPLSRSVSAQPPTPIPKLDLTQFIGGYFEIERLPDKRERSCINHSTVLYALGDKANTLQLVTSCRIKGDWSSWDAKGKLDKAGDGSLKVTYIWPFTTKYWVFATGPAYEWVVVGSPNHKTLWVLSKTETLPDATLAEAVAKASAAGFDTAKLVKVVQRDEIAAASPKPSTKP